MAESRPPAAARVWGLTLLVAFLAASLPAFPQETSTPPPAVSHDEAVAAGERGRQLFQQAQFASALIQFEQALAGGQRDGRTLYMAARCQERTKKSRGIIVMTLTEAIPALEAAVKAADADLTDFAFMSAAYSLVGNEPTARAAGRNGVAAFKAGRLGSLESMDDIALTRLGNMALLAEDWDLAGDSLGPVVDHAADGNEQDKVRAAGALLSLGRGRLGAGNAQEAIPLLRRSLDLNPGNIDTLVTLASALFRAGDYAGAAKGWRNVRLNDVTRANDATYATMVMLTLAQEEKLRHPDRPLEDLSTLNDGQLEQQMLTLAGEMGTLAGELPEETVKRGFGNPTGSPEVREQIKEFRDLKLRLAWTSATYIDRGRPIREFAFARGIQGYLRNWRLINFRMPGDNPDVDLTWLSEKQREEYLVMAKEREGRRAERLKKRTLRLEERRQREKEAAGDS